MKVGILDYGASNIQNVGQALKHLGHESVTVTNNDPGLLAECSVLILPGVGAFGKAMQEIRARKLDLFIHEYVKQNKPLIGICLGMQLLLDEGHEFGRHAGLGLITGTVEQIPTSHEGQKIRIPHVGWSYLSSSDNISDHQCVYFVHSFRGVLKNESDVVATADYFGIKIPAIIRKGNIVGIQFHPEKSGEAGLAILKEYLSEATT